MRCAAMAAAMLVMTQGAALAQPPADAVTPAEPTQPAIADPFEGFNRAVFGFNNGVDRILIEPLARGYRAVTPGFVRTGVTNALHNLRSPVIFANDVLQGSPSRAGTTAGRFVVNSTIGLVGLIDVGAQIGLPRHSEDFGQTLAVWGAGPGPYLVLPLLGPSTLRDALGRPIDAAFDPFNYLDGQDIDAVRGGRVGLTVVSAREQAIEAVDALRRTSIDPYVSLRSIYAQAREGDIRNGAQDVEALPDFGEIPQ